MTSWSWFQIIENAQKNRRDRESEQNKTIMKGMGIALFRTTKNKIKCYGGRDSQKLKMHKKWLGVVFPNKKNPQKGMLLAFPNREKQTKVRGIASPNN